MSSIHGLLLPTTVVSSQITWRTCKQRINKCINYSYEYIWMVGCGWNMWSKTRYRGQWWILLISRGVWICSLCDRICKLIIYIHIYRRTDYVVNNTRNHVLLHLMGNVSISDFSLCAWKQQDTGTFLINLYTKQYNEACNIVSLCFNI